MKQILNSFCGRRSSLFLLILLSLLIILPLIMLSQYNHPSADDFCYTNYAKSMDYWDVQLHHYSSWTGRYTATLLLTLSTTDVHDLTEHRIIPIFLIISFCFSIYFFISRIAPDLRLTQKWTLAFLVLFLYCVGVPTLSEAFFWKPAALTYQLALILALIFFSLILHLRRLEKSKARTGYTVLASVLSMIITGLNETIMLIMLITLFSSFLLDWFQRKKPDPALGSILLVTMAASAIVILAPGNFNRMEGKPDKWRLIPTIYNSFKYAVHYLLYWSPLLLLLFLLCSRSFIYAAREIRSRYGFFGFSKPHVLVFGIFLLASLALSFSLSFWSQGGAPPPRTINTIYLLFIIGAFSFLVLGIISFLNSGGDIPQVPRLLKITSAILVLVLVGTKAGDLLRTNNLRVAYLDLLTGKAQRYDLELQQRYSLLDNCGDQECLVPPLRNKPETLMSYQLASHQNTELYFYNQCAAIYFDTKCLFVSEAGITK